MIRQTICGALVLCAVTAWAADEKRPMDKSKPGMRMPTDEGKTKKEITDFFKREEEAHKSANFEATLDRMDFPVFMVTDNAEGIPSAKTYTREEYVAIAKPAFEKMPKDVKMDRNPNITVLSDYLANVSMENTMTGPNQKITSRSAGVLIKTNGQWKWKTMAQGGWGDVNTPRSGRTAPVTP